MKFTFISSTSFFQDIRTGGAESSMFEAAVQLSMAGHSCSYVVLQDHKIKASYIKLIIDAGVKIVNLSSGKTRKLLQKIKATKLNQHIAKAKLIIHLIADRPDFVYCYYEPDVLDLLNSLPRKYFKFKLIMRMAGLYWYYQLKDGESSIHQWSQRFSRIDFINYIHSSQEKYTLAKASEVGLNIDCSKNFVWDIGSSSLSSPLNPNAATLKWELTTEDASPKFLIVCATRLTRYQKRHDILIDAFTQCCSKIQDAHLIIIGSGDNEDCLKAKVCDSPVANNVTFMPYLDQLSLWRLICKCQLFCHPTDFEGLGKIVVEALSLGVPLLASNVPVLSSYIQDGVNGYLVDNDASSWSNKILSIYNNYDKIEEVSHAALAGVSSSREYEPSHQVELLIKELSSLS